VIDVEPLIIEKLDRLVPAPGTAGLDWRDVERRAGVSRPRRRRVLTAVVLLGLLFVAVGFTRSLGGFGGWLNGEPGKPASTAEQRAFARSIRSWVGFPQGTTLRQLVATTVDGARYTLDGFRGDGSLCLRLVVSGGQSADELSCPPLSQLRANSAPALVVAADYGVGEGENRASGLPFPFYGFTPAAMVTLGIVADGVQKVEVSYSDGTTADAVVSGDTFLAVADRPAAGDHLTHVWAIAGGNRVSVPFVLQPTPFEWPAATAPQLSAHGPSQVQRVIHGGTISWLAHRRPIGVPVPKNVHDIIGTSKSALYAREITPNRSAPERMVVSIVPNHDVRSGHRFGGPYQVCLDVIGGRYRGGGCWPTEQLFSTAPFSEGVGTESGSQYVTVAGLASDDVARITLYLGNGQTEAVPLNDNAYLIEAPIIDYPLRLVAYDNHGLVIGIVTLQGNTPRPKGAPQPPQPVANAKWRHLFTNNAGEVFVAPSTGGGTCYAIAQPGSRGVSCQPKLSADELNFGAYGSPKQGTTLEFHSGSAIAEVVILYKNGHRQIVKAIDGIALAKIPTAETSTAVFHGAVSLTGLNAGGDVVKTVNLFSLIGGTGAITRLTPTEITIGSAECRITSASPSLTGYTSGAKVQYLCHQGVLTLIGRAKPGHSWNSRTVLIRGPIVALSANAITVKDSILASTGNSAPKQTCKINFASPTTNGYRVGKQVQIYCVGGELTGINRTTPG
jgi:hypothetical protein